MPPAAAPPRRETVASTPSVVPRPHAAKPLDNQAPTAEDEAPEPDSAAEAPIAAATPALLTPAANIVTQAPIADPARDRTGAPGTGTAQATPTVESSVPSRFAEDLSLEVIKRAWPHVLTAFKKSPSGAPWLEKGEVVVLEGHTIVLAFAETFARDRIQNNAKGKAKVEQGVIRSRKPRG